MNLFQEPPSEGALSSSFGEPSSPPRSPSSRVGEVFLIASCSHGRACTRTLFAGGASSPSRGDDREPFRDEVEQLLGDGAGEEEEGEGEGEDLFGDNFERYVCV